MKKQKFFETINPFDVLSEEIIFIILDLLSSNPVDKKSFSMVCKSFYILESKHRKKLKPLRQDRLSAILSRRYQNITDLDLSRCPKVTDKSLMTISKISNLTLLSINLSRPGAFSSSGLMSLTLNCKNLVEIDISNSMNLRDTGAAALAEAKNLEKLWMARCKLVTDIGIMRIALGCKKLRLISLKWCIAIGDYGVGLIALKCEQIRNLDLSYLPITKKCLPSILKLKHLEELVLEGCFGIDDDSLATLKHGCKSLKALDMSSCENISHLGLSSLTNGTECLQQLTLARGSPITLELADGLKKLSMLQSIKLDDCMVTCAGLKAIGDWCVSLKEFSVSKCLGVTDEGLASVVTNHKELGKLNITCCRQITDLSIAHITGSCTSLTSLRMELCSLVSREAFVLIGQRCRLLEELDLTENEVDDEGLKSISRCSKLSVLKIGLCPNITDKGLTHVGMCSKLKELDLYRSTGITDLGISAVAYGCPDLEMINIAHCKEVGDAALLTLSKCSKLHTLESRGCPGVTSLGIKAIAVGCKRLTKLDIKMCGNIDDAGMLELAKFSQNLRQINLSYSSVTDVGLLSLASIGCLQSMTILHLKGLTPRGLAAALLACGGLTKVKLHTSFQSSLPQHLFDLLEARGCLFVWRNKTFQMEDEAP